MNAQKEDISIGELLQRIKNGDRQARKELFGFLGDETEFGNVIQAMARNLLLKNHWARRLVDTRDIVQSALCTGLSQFSDFRGDTEGELFGWLKTILRTKVNRVIRRKGNVNVDPVKPDLIEGKDDDLVPLSAIIDRELLEILRAAIQKLPLDQRLVVELRLRGVNAPEIGKMLGLQSATIRKRESRAVEKLKEIKEVVD